MEGRSRTNDTDRHKGRKSKIYEFERKLPQYVLDLFRRALRDEDVDHIASFQMIVAKMKELSAMDEAPNDPGEAFPFTTTGVYRWFKARGAKERSGRLEKPLVTEEHIRQ